MAENTNKNEQVQDINQLLKVRRQKFADLQAEGKDPFVITKFDQTHHTSDVKEIYTEYEAKMLEGWKEPSVDGLSEEEAKEAIMLPCYKYLK